MRKLTSVDEIKLGMTIRFVNEEFEMDMTLVVTSLEPADKCYGKTSIYVNDYRVDVFEEDVYEVVDVNNLVDNVVEITQRLAHTPDRSFTQKDGYAEKTFKTTITSVEDKGDYYYVGHRPLEFKNGRFGYFRVFKTGAKKYGVVAINGIELY